MYYAFKHVRVAPSFGRCERGFALTPDQVNIYDVRVMLCVKRDERGGKVASVDGTAAAVKGR